MASGIRKAAMLLAALDPSASADLLKGASPEVIKQIAAEMAWLQASGEKAGPQGPLREFAALLARGSGREQARHDIVRSLLMSTIGPQQGEHALDEVQQLIKARDPFGPVRSAKVDDIARALDGESPQAVAMVLAELGEAASSELIRRLDESVRAEAVGVLIGGASAMMGARIRVAKVVRDRLDAMRQRPSGQTVVEEAAPEKGVPDGRLRRVALLLRRLEPAMRDGLIAAIAERDGDGAAKVRDLMVVWSDVAVVADRGLQTALRGVDSRRLALALWQADKAVNAKVRGNISERAAAMIDEEASLLSDPKPEDIEQARQDVLTALRELNARGEVKFEEAS